MLPLSKQLDDKPLSDIELISKVISGNNSAFEPLMRRYNRMLYRTARSFVKDDAEAEDVSKLIERVEQDDDVSKVFHNMG